MKNGNLEWNFQVISEIIGGIEKTFPATGENIQNFATPCNFLKRSIIGSEK